MKNIISTAAILLNLMAFGQIGINTNSPKATLDIVAKTTNGSKPEGLIPPKLSGNEIKSGDNRYGAAQKGTVVYATEAVTSASAKTTAIKSEGYYYFDGSKWKMLIDDNHIVHFSYGDIRAALKSSDHNGWVLLNGRAINTLSPTQQIVAASLNFTSNLPNASNSYLVKNGLALGSLTGSNVRKIVQNQLPNFSPPVTIASSSAGTPTGSVILDKTTSTMLTAGTHNHGIYRQGNGVDDVYDAGDLHKFESSAITTDRPILGSFVTGASTTVGIHTHNMDPHSHSASFTGNTLPNHTHTAVASSINGGVTQQDLDITPKSMSVNMFVYLGN